jgi:hypothetical protein
LHEAVIGTIPSLENGLVEPDVLLKRLAEVLPSSLLDESLV